MKNLYTLALAFITFATFAQNEKSLLYRVSGNGITTPSYIFGTIHISCEVKLDEAIQKALLETNQLYLELDMDDPEMQMNMMKSINMKDGVTISSLVSAEDFKLLDDYMLSKMKVSAKSFDTYKPFVLSSMFLTTLLDCSPQSYENELVAISTQQKEPIYGLETVQEQMDIFDQIPYQLQAEELIKSIKNNFKEDKIELSLMFKTYASKDLNEMERLSRSSKNVISSDYQDLLLKNRNLNWIPLIERITRTQPTFFGVGAAHLAGDEGVLNLLRKNGFTVEAL